MNERIYTSVKLSNGDNVVVMEVTGAHMIATAMILGPQSSNPLLFVYNLAAICSKINGKAIGLEYMSSLAYCDLDSIVMVIGNQMQKIDTK